MAKEFITKLFDFIEKGKSPYHVIYELEKEYCNHGLVEYREQDEWQPGKKQDFFVKRSDTSIIAVKFPKDISKVKGFHISAAHSDCPTFSVKENADMVAEGVYHKLNIEKYGGMILSSWFDRPLSVAGRVFVEENGNIRKYLIDMDKNLCVIPSLAIHMNRDTNKGIAYNVQNDMLPLYGMGQECNIMEEIARELNVKKEQILGKDLTLYVRETPCLVGADEEFIVSRALDDLECVFACKEAFLKETPKEYINVCAVFHNEEVGSMTRQGADSDFLVTVLKRIGDACSKESGIHLFERWMPESFLVSADNAHGVHPNFPQKADPTNRPLMNHGMVIKYSANQKYTTDGETGAYWKLICKNAGVPYQTYVNHSDVVGGSTLGNILTTHLNLKAVDLGFAQLAMHSAVETAGSADLAYGIDAICKFYQQ